VHIKVQLTTTEYCGLWSMVFLAVFSILRTSEYPEHGGRRLLRLWRENTGHTADGARV
jgi:hypothetical protein